MADRFDRFDKEGGGGGSFVMGLLTGTVLGAGLGMLFAPKAGSALRRELSEQVGNLANTATDGYRKATETAGQWAEKGRKAALEDRTEGRALPHEQSKTAFCAAHISCQNHCRRLNLLTRK